jgi:mono/diheme cytochrome c family protein/rhodanese-related sulfurtransferase
MTLMTVSGVLIVGSPGDAAAFQLPEQTEEEAKAAAANYRKYCSLCHGADRQGYVNNRAPSLRSRQLLSTGFPMHMAATTAYGRRGTPMGGYLDEIGGPMTMDEIGGIMLWLRAREEVELVDLPRDLVSGDVAAGEKVYARECATCHGAYGEGGIGTALGNPGMLSMTTDPFLRYAIEHGRDGTEMPAFGDVLSEEEMDAVTAFLRSRAAGWSLENTVLRAPPTADEYVLNPDSPAPAFELMGGLYVRAGDLLTALESKRRMVLLDTRVMSLWQMAHIEGAVPLPYHYDYNDLGSLAEDIPADGTWIVLYCESPRAVAESVRQRLLKRGFENTAVLWEGLGGWTSLGYPVIRGEIAPMKE